MMKKYSKIGIVGGGPAGYALALKLAMGGCFVLLFEKEKLGGTWLNKGCIPTKSILHNTNLIYKTKNLSKFGLKIDDSEFDFSKITDNKNSTVEKLNKSLGNFCFNRKNFNTKCRLWSWCRCYSYRYNTRTNKSVTLW